MVKLADTHASEACGSNPVEVQVLSRAQKFNINTLESVDIESYEYVGEDLNTGAMRYQ